MKKIFDFDNITLLPNFSRVESRSDCDTTCVFGGHRFKLPIVPANMESIIGSKRQWCLGMSEITESF